MGLPERVAARWLAAAGDFKPIVDLMSEVLGTMAAANAKYKAGDPRALEMHALDDKLFDHWMGNTMMQLDKGVQMWAQMPEAIEGKFRRNGGKGLYPRSYAHSDDYFDWISELTRDRSFERNFAALVKALEAWKRT